MQKLYRSQQNKKIAGICGGLGVLMDVDPTIVRLAVVILGLATGILPFLVGYIVAWWIVPKKTE
jgi:phage shock protein C